WRLTGGKVHATDATNASRTLLFDIHSGQWDDDLLKILRVPRSMLPEVKDSSGKFGDSVPELFGGAIAISGIAGDQQAATIGQACFAPGMIKSTYGTGCFALLNTGTAELAHAALESVCYQTFDLWAAMRADWPEAKAANIVLRVDGGMTASDWTMQRLADLLDAPVDRPMIQETTALGAAYLAGLAAGVYPEPVKFADNWRLE